MKKREDGEIAYGNDNSIVEEDVAFLLMTSQLSMLPRRNDKHSRSSQ